MLGYLYWDPNPIIFIIPYINHPVRWYGPIFVIGFVISYFIMQKLLVHKLAQHSNDPEDALKQQALNLTDKLTLYILIGTVIGARLGHVFFYEWPRYQHNWWAIVKTWEGGLASHGGAVGIILALFLFVWRTRKKYPFFTTLTLLDYTVICSGLVGFFIRMGNFVNQEITGYPTRLPWAVIFGHPAEGGLPVPRHPVQLYEALFYLLVFVVMIVLWYKKRDQMKEGTFLGLGFVTIFTFRFFIEFLKLPQSMSYNESSLFDMGQYLSIPFVIVGIFLLLRKTKHRTSWVSS